LRSFGADVSAKTGLIAGDGMWIDPYRKGSCLNVSASKIDAVYVLEGLL
jgi:hypothetical protein